MHRRTFLEKAGAASLCLGFGGLSHGQSGELDLLFKGGLLVDGSGRPGRAADLGVQGARIRALSDLSQATARRTFDVSGLVVSPGFIDVHTLSEDEPCAGTSKPCKREGTTLRPYPGTARGHGRARFPES